MLKPSPDLMKSGSSTRSMYQPKLLHVCVMMMAHTGTDVTMLFQGTGIFSWP
jgi:hypothetical protein